MGLTTSTKLSRRESQAMDVIYRLGQATAAEVREGLPDPPTYSAVRATLRVLEEKGHLSHEQQGQRYVYRPTLARGRARKSALRHLLRTFFDNSAEQVVATLLDVEAGSLTQQQLERLSNLIEQARENGG